MSRVTVDGHFYPPGSEQPQPPQAAPAPPPQQTPSQRIVAAGNAVRTVSDDRGRAIQYRRLNALERFRLTAALGADNARNDTLAFMAEVACSVRQVDEDPVGFPANYKLVEALVARLDDAGMNAVMQDMAEVVRAQQEAGGLTDLERAKNSRGTAA